MSGTIDILTFVYSHIWWNYKEITLHNQCIAYPGNVRQAIKKQVRMEMKYRSLWAHRTFSSFYNLLLQRANHKTVSANPYTFKIKTKRKQLQSIKHYLHNDCSIRMFWWKVNGKTSGTLSFSNIASLKESCTKALYSSMNCLLYNYYRLSWLSSYLLKNNLSYGGIHSTFISEGQNHCLNSQQPIWSYNQFN